MTAGQVLSVSRAEDDGTPCRRCDSPIRRGQRIVLVLGTGTVHLRCVVGHQGDDAGQPQQTEE